MLGRQLTVQVNSRLSKQAELGRERERERERERGILDWLSKMAWINPGKAVEATTLRISGSAYHAGGTSGIHGLFGGA